MARLIYYRLNGLVNRMNDCLHCNTLTLWLNSQPCGAEGDPLDWFWNARAFWKPAQSGSRHYLILACDCEPIAT